MGFLIYHVITIFTGPLNVSFVLLILPVFTGRMPRSGKLPVLNLLTGQKSGFSPGRLVAPIHVKLGRNDGHVGPLGCAIAPGGWEYGPPKYQKFPLFGKDGATPLTDFRNF